MKKSLVLKFKVYLKRGLKSIYTYGINFPSLLPAATTTDFAYKLFLFYKQTVAF